MRYHIEFKHKKLLIALIVLFLVFIWGNSMMPASISKGVSGWLKDIINMLLSDAGGDKTLLGEEVLRKIAHAAEFAALGMVLMLLMEEGHKTKVAFLALCGLGAALIDETIQLFVDGRSGQIKDIWIDLAGFVIGVLLVWLIIGIAQKRKMRHGCK